MVQIVTRKAEEKAMGIQEQDTVDYRQRFAIPESDGLEPEERTAVYKRSQTLHSTVHSQDSQVIFLTSNFNFYMVKIQFLFMLWRLIHFYLPKRAGVSHCDTQPQVCTPCGLITERSSACPLLATTRRSRLRGAHKIYVKLALANFFEMFNIGVSLVLIMISGHFFLVE